MGHQAQHHPPEPSVRAAPLFRRQSLCRNDLHCSWRWQACSLGSGGPQAEGAQDLGKRDFWLGSRILCQFLVFRRDFATVSYILLYCSLLSSDLKRAFNVTTSIL